MANNKPSGEARHFTVPAKTYGFEPDDFDSSHLPDFDTNFLSPEHLDAFIQALAAPDPLQSPEEGATRSPGLRSISSFDVSKRSSSAVPAGEQQQQQQQPADTPQSVAAHAAAASGTELAAPVENNNNNSSNSNDPDQNHGGVGNKRPPLFISAKNDWAPVYEKVLRPPTSARRSRRQRRRAAPPGGSGSSGGRRTKDETREGYLYGLLKWPFLVGVSAWIVGLAAAYVLTRLYVAAYEQLVTWRGRRERLRRRMRATSRYADWVAAARDLDDFLGNAPWKEDNEFAYYDSRTVRRVWDQMRKCRVRAEAAERELEAGGASTSGSGSGSNGGGGQGPAEKERGGGGGGGEGGNDQGRKATEDLKALIEACVKNNFVGVENPRLYSQTYYGTKNLVQNFVDEVERSLQFLISTKQLDMAEKRVLFKRLNANYGRTALCLSGGASFAYYHFGVVRGLLDEDLLPDVITGTSGGALVAGLVATRTNDELRQLLVPALADNINACSEPLAVWLRRWWRTGARFDSVAWAKQCSWWCRGSMTFREAYERTGRILNVSCVPADPHSPTILCNYLTSPDCVIWSAVLASAAVPGILNPVVLMMKTPGGDLAPYSFGHKWKDGSLRTDIPVKALNLHFNVNFTVVSQVNPHINLFFFSSRGSVGQPVTHRRGRGWRGGYLGSAFEQYLKLDLTKWLKVLRHLELLPRPLGQDWSQLWLQQFGGTVTIWPRSVASDFWRLLADPDPPRLARMLHEGRQSVFPRLKFISNRLRVERLVERGRLASRPAVRRGSIETIMSEDDLRSLLLRRRRRRPRPDGANGSTTATSDDDDDDDDDYDTSAAEGEVRANGGGSVTSSTGGGGGGGAAAALDEEAVDDADGDDFRDVAVAKDLAIKKTE